MAWEILEAGISVAIGVTVAVVIVMWTQKSIVGMLGETVHRIFHSKEIEIPETKEKRSLAEILADAYLKLSALFERIIKPEGKSSGESEKRGEEEIRVRYSFSLWSKSQLSLS